MLTKNVNSEMLTVNLLVIEGQKIMAVIVMTWTNVCLLPELELQKYSI